MLKKIDHINIVVENLDVAKSFFMTLGFTIQGEAELTGKWIDALTGLKKVKAHYVGLHLKGCETNIELLQFLKPKGNKQEGIASVNQMGFRHMAFEVADIEKVVAKLKGEKVTFISEIQTYKPANKKLCYLLGPKG